MQKVTARDMIVSKSESLFFHEPHPAEPAANKFHRSELKWHSHRSERKKIGE